MKLAYDKELNSVKVARSFTDPVFGSWGTGTGRGVRLMPQTPQTGRRRAYLEFAVELDRSGPALRQRDTRIRVNSFPVAWTHVKDLLPAGEPSIDLLLNATHTEH